MSRTSGLIERLEAQLRAKAIKRNSFAERLNELRDLNRDLSDAEVRETTDLRVQLSDADEELDTIVARVDELRADQAREDLAARSADDRGTGTYDVRMGGDGGHRVVPPAPAGRASGARFAFRDRPDVPAAVERGQRFAEHPIVREHAAARADHDRLTEGVYNGSITNMVRSLTTSGASAVVPTSWSAAIIDRARNAAAVMRAGASVVPMPTQTVYVGRITGDPTAAVRAEGSSITATDPSFDNVALTAKSLNCLVVATNEWLADAENADELLTNVIGKSMGLAIDLAALYGGITAGAGSINLPTPPTPRGVLAALNALRPANVLGGAAANGTTPTNWNELINLDFLLEAANEDPTGYIFPSRLANKYATLYDTMGQPLRKPDALSDLEEFTSNQVASGMTQGTSTTAADLFLADWGELIIGQRLELEIRVLTERYADLGQTGIVASWRGDVALARPSAFGVYRYLNGM